QLAAALKQTDTAHEIHWHPFELNPNMPSEGQNMREHITGKYGSSKQESDASRAQITAVGSEVGFEFNFTDELRMHNTFNLHQLLQWADQTEPSHMHDLIQALFPAHFTNGRYISDIEVLCVIAAEVGLDRHQALIILEDQRFATEVRAEEQHWQQQGIQSVPAMVFNERHLVSGAQGVENYVNILEQLANMRE
ncbi:MAG: DsbA family oxidoreductase, partial [Psychrobacter sp.]|nr:DsbA family oxidoreductase [Psychrobacter sp.]